MNRSTEKMLTTHNGSLPRPPELSTMIRAREKGEAVDQELFDSAVHDAVADVARRQADTGLTVINDGEQGRYLFSHYIFERLSGLEVIDAREITSFGDLLQDVAAREDAPEIAKNAARDPLNRDWYARFSPNSKAPLIWKNYACTGPITYTGHDAIKRDLENLRQAMEGLDVDDVFVSCTSPRAAAGSIEDRYYEDMLEMIQAFADALKEEYKAIVDAGFILQIDCPGLAAGDDEAARMMLEMQIEMLNYALEGLPEEQLRMHVCFGGDEGPHHLDPELQSFVDVLVRARPQAMTIAAANPRHEHEWRVWEDVTLPEGKVIIPGVIDSTTNFIEHPDLVAERIVRYAGVLGKENMIAGVDCGFAGTPDTDHVLPSIAWKKLESLAEGARRATEQLWGK